VESKNMPPFMPKRKLDDSFDHLSLVSNLSMGRDTSDTDDDSSSGCYWSENEDDPAAHRLRIAANRGSIKANLERVLGEVLDRLEDDGEDPLAFD
jgi:hypothetical protein